MPSGSRQYSGRRPDFPVNLLVEVQVFVSQERVSGFPEKGADLRGSPGNFRGSPGNFWGSLGNFRGTSGLLLSSTVRELPGKSPKNSGEVRGTSGEVRGISRSSGEPDSLPTTRQLCLQLLKCSQVVGSSPLDICTTSKLPVHPDSCHLISKGASGLFWGFLAQDTRK